MYQLIITLYSQSTELHGTLGLKINDWLIELQRNSSATHRLIYMYGEKLMQMSDSKKQPEKEEVC